MKVLGSDIAHTVVENGRHGCNFTRGRISWLTRIYPSARTANGREQNPITPPTAGGGRRSPVIFVTTSMMSWFNRPGGTSHDLGYDSRWMRLGSWCYSTSSRLWRLSSCELADTCMQPVSKLKNRIPCHGISQDTGRGWSGHAILLYAQTRYRYESQMRVRVHDKQSEQHSCSRANWRIRLRTGWRCASKTAGHLRSSGAAGRWTYDRSHRRLTMPV